MNIDLNSTEKYWRQAAFKRGRLLQRFCLLGWLCLPVIILGQTRYTPVQSYEHLPSNYRIKNVQANSDSSVWIGTSNGVYYTKSEKDAPVRLLKKSLHFFAIDQDRQFIYTSLLDSLYVSSTDSTQQAPLFATSVADLVKDKDYQNITQLVANPENSEEVWGATSEFIFKCAKKNNWQLEPFKIEGLSSPTSVNGIYIENQHSIWIATDLGLFLFDGKTLWKSFLKNIRIKAISNARILKDKVKRIWVTGGENIQSRKLWAFNYISRTSDPAENKDNFQYLSMNTVDLSAQKIKGDLKSLHFASNGDLWLGASGIFRYKNLASHADVSTFAKDSLDLYFRMYDQAKGFKANYITALDAQPDGLLWLGTDKGVSTLKPNIYFMEQEKKMITCHKEQNGAFKLKAEDGQPPYQFLLSAVEAKNIAPANQNNLTGEISFTYLPPADYLIGVTDYFKKDTFFTTISILDPGPITAELKKYRPPFFADQSNGVARVENVKGGWVNPGSHFQVNNRFENYLFIWEQEGYKDTMRIPEYEKLPVGKFKVTIVDTVGCKTVLEDRYLHPASISRTYWEAETIPDNYILLTQLDFGHESLEINERASVALEEVNMFCIQKNFASVVIAPQIPTKGQPADYQRKIKGRGQSVKNALMNMGIAGDRITVALESPDKTGGSYKNGDRMEIWIYK
jgi:hypothetical protein